MKTIVALIALLICTQAQAGMKRSIGVIPSSPDGSSNVLEAIDQARSIGADPLYWYVSWADITSLGINAVMPKITSTGRSVVLLSLINTTTLGKYPAPWTNFTEPGFEDAFLADATEFVSVWKPTYLCLANEAGTYLASHPDDIDEYEHILKSLRDRVREVSPQTRVCVTLSFTESIKDGHALANRFAKVTDVTVWTVYGSENGMMFLNPSYGIELIDRIEAESPRPFAIGETSWSSAPELGSSEKAQAEFAKMLVNHKTSAQFIVWFYLRDGLDCSAPAKRFRIPMSDTQFDMFKSFICNFGAYKSTGEPKATSTILWPSPDNKK
jgi:hypothetical protein